MDGWSHVGEGSFVLGDGMLRTRGGSGWNTLTVTLDGVRTRVHVNDTLVTDHTEGDPVPPKEESYEPDRGPRPAEGYIDPQHHGDGDTVHYRRVRVRPLGE
jgi:hypothetical protein